MKSQFYTLLSFVILAILVVFVFTKWIDKKSTFNIQTKEISEGEILFIRNAWLPNETNEKMHVCDKYHYIELNFHGEHEENLRTVTSCISTKNKKDIKSILIPFAHIYTFPAQTGEFTTDAYTKIYISNPQKKWPKQWNLQSVKLFNSEKDYFFISKPHVSFDVKSWIKPL